MRINNRFSKFLLLNILICVWINSVIYVIQNFEYSVTDGESYKRKAILLLASYRSGSSLTGELFNQHEDVLYFFGNLAYIFRVGLVLRNPYNY